MYNHQIYTFIQVADAGSFSKAVEALYISSTAVMKQTVQKLMDTITQVMRTEQQPKG